MEEGLAESHVTLRSNVVLSPEKLFELLKKRSYKHLLPFEHETHISSLTRIQNTSLDNHDDEFFATGMEKVQTLILKKVVLKGREIEQHSSDEYWRNVLKESVEGNK